MSQADSANRFVSTVVKKHPTTEARVVSVGTPHGEFLTPCFMPVGTHAAVSSLTPESLRGAGVQMILGGNTYHMICSPGLEVIRALGGMHRFMGWNGPMLTDSGGYQIFSLSRSGDRCRIGEEGAEFKEPSSGRLVRLTPDSSVEAQKVLGADIIMALDQCTPDSSDRRVVEDAMLRTHRWLAASRAKHDADPDSAYGRRQAFFGIIQGGPFRDLRERSAAEVVSQDPDGVAIGGESIGYNMPKTVEILSWIVPMIPEGKLRYTMGVGLGPQDLIAACEAGADMFDCVAPTRNARHGALYCGRIVRERGRVRWESDEPNGRINLNNSRFRTDDRPVMDGCGCRTCASYSRGYLRFLLKAGALSYHSLASIHNVYVMQEVCRAIRASVLDG